MNQEPKKKKKRVKDKRISFYILKKDYEILEENSKNFGLNKSEFIRRMCCSKNENLEVLKENFLKNILELKRIGNNLNQISKKLNQGSELEIDLNEFKGDLTKAIDELKEMAKKD
jgi:uncharacterized protein YpuA (DUF1002 family)